MRALFSFRTLLLLVLVFSIGWLGAASVRTEIHRLEQGNANLSALIDSFGQDGVLELEARRRLNVKKPGEEVVIILPPKANGDIALSDDWNEISAQNTQQDNVQEQKGEFARHLEEWWKFVFE
jgi:hypothetical protein